MRLARGHAGQHRVDASVHAPPVLGPDHRADEVPVRPVALQVREFDVPAGSHPHDVAPAADGAVWYTGQRTGVLGHLDPATGDIREIRLGDGSAPHGVITGADGAAWITDSRNAIVRVDWRDRRGPHVRPAVRRARRTA